MQSSNRKNLFILSFTLVVVTLGFGVVIPIIPFYMENLGASGTELGILLSFLRSDALVIRPNLGQSIRSHWAQTDHDDRHPRLWPDNGALRISN